MAYGRRVRFEELRSIPFGSISGSYAAIGGATGHETRLFSVYNSTDVDVYISLDGTAAHLQVAAGSGQIFDLTANKVRDDGLFIDEGTIFYCEQVSAGPTKGSVWVEVLYATGGV